MLAENSSPEKGRHWETTPLGSMRAAFLEDQDRWETDTG